MSRPAGASQAPRMSVTREDVLHVAALARLEFDDAGLARMQDQLNAILAYVDTLQHLDTADVAPTSHPFPAAAPLRPDTAQPSALHDALLAIAPHRDGRNIIVPRVIE